MLALRGDTAEEPFCSAAQLVSRMPGSFARPSARELDSILAMTEHPEKALGPEDPNVAICLEGYASLLRNMSRQDEAALLESRTKAIRAKNAATDS
jgi:hypothetical protein